MIRDTDEKNAAAIFEAMEAVTNAHPQAADIGWLRFADRYILNKNNRIKREASRIAGNIAHMFPDELDKTIEKLLINSKDQGTVVRWSSAYGILCIHGGQRAIRVWAPEWTERMNQNGATV